MKKYWKLSRGKRTAVNLLLAAVVHTLIWGLKGYPLPTTEMEFHRMERENLLPPSEIVFSSKEDTTLQWRDLPNLSISWNEVVVGAETDWVHVADLLYDTMEVWHLEEGITPVPMYRVIVMQYWPGLHSGVALMFFHVPEETERAEIRIDAKDQNGEASWYEGEGWRMAPGQWMFCTYPGESYSGNWYAGGDYTLRLYRTDGSLLTEQSGWLPE